MYDIVAVEDAEALRSVLAKVFESLGWQTLLCGSGEEALQALEREGAKVLVTDLDVPGVTEALLTEEVRKLYPSLRIIALTHEMAKSNMRLGDFTCVVYKPFRMSYLARVLSECLVADEAKGQEAGGTS